MADYTYEVEIDGKKYRVTSKTKLTPKQAEEQVYKVIGFKPVNPLNFDVKPPGAKETAPNVNLPLYVDKVIKDLGPSKQNQPKTPKKLDTITGVLQDILTPGSPGFRDPAIVGRLRTVAKTANDIKAEAGRRKAQIARREITSNPNPNAPKYTPDEIDDKWLESMDKEELAAELDKRNELQKKFRSPQTWNDYLRALNKYQEKTGFVGTFSPANIAENLAAEGQVVASDRFTSGSLTGSTAKEQAGAALNIASWVVPLEEIIGKNVVNHVAKPLLKAIETKLFAKDFAAVDRMISEVLPPRALEEARTVLRKAEGELQVSKASKAKIATASADTGKSLSVTPEGPKPSEPAKTSKPLSTGKETPTKPVEVKNAPKTPVETAKAPVTETVTTTQPSAGSKRVSVGDKTFDLEGDALDAFNQLESNYKKRLETIDRSGLTAEEKAAGKKAAGMEFSAQKRKLLGAQTVKEQKLSNQMHSGDPVVLPDGREGMYRQTTFGKAQVLVDGEVVTVPHSDLTKKAVPELKGIKEVPLEEKVKLSKSEEAQQVWEEAVSKKTEEIMGRNPNVQDWEAKIMAEAEVRGSGIKPPDVVQPKAKPKTISGEVLGKIDQRLEELNAKKPKKPPGGKLSGSVRIPIEEVERIALLAIRTVVATGEKAEVAIRRLLKQEGFGDEHFDTIAKAYNDHADFYDIPVEKTGPAGRVSSDFNKTIDVERPGGLRNIDFLTSPKGLKNEVTFDGKTYRSWDEARASAEELLSNQDILDVLGEAKKSGRGMSDVERQAAGIERDSLKGQLLELQDKIDRGQGLLSSEEINALQDQYNNAFQRFTDLIKKTDEIGSQNGRNLAAHKAIIDLTGVDPETIIRRAKVIAKRDLTKDEVASLTQASLKAMKKSEDLDRFYEKRLKEAIEVLSDSKKVIPGGNLENC